MMNQTMTALVVLTLGCSERWETVQLRELRLGPPTTFVRRTPSSFERNPNDLVPCTLTGFPRRDLWGAVIRMTEAHILPPGFRIVHAVAFRPRVTEKAEFDATRPAQSNVVGEVSVALDIRESVGRISIHHGTTIDEYCLSIKTNSAKTVEIEFDRRSHSE